MKKLSTILVVILFLIMGACSKMNNKRMTVIKDCTGTYLQYKGKDYHVCNIELTNEIEDGTKVRASFVEIEDCLGLNGAVCEMLHMNEGWVKVTKIR